jgi:hypothetical protein
MTAPVVAQTAKCSYLAERWAVLSQVSILVGRVWLAAKWACGDGSYPGEGEWEFYCDQLRLVCSFHLQELTLHAHEWSAQPLQLPEYKEGPCRIP